VATGDYTIPPTWNSGVQLGPPRRAPPGPSPFSRWAKERWVAGVGALRETPETVRFGPGLRPKRLQPRPPHLEKGDGPAPPPRSIFLVWTRCDRLLFPVNGLGPMKYLPLTTAVAMSLFMVSSGCGTLANLNGQSYPLMGGTEPTRPFGGVRRDMRWISSVTVPYNLMFVADLPVSMAGDIATLPVSFRKDRTLPSAEEAPSSP
jgi:hypothetical protein